jgi:hypothetical protein
MDTGRTETAGSYTPPVREINTGEGVRGGTATVARGGGNGDVRTPSVDTLEAMFDAPSAADPHADFGKLNDGERNQSQQIDMAVKPDTRTLAEIHLATQVLPGTKPFELNIKPPGGTDAIYKNKEANKNLTPAELKALLNSHAPSLPITENAKRSAGKTKITTEIIPPKDARESRAVPDQVIQTEDRKTRTEEEKLSEALPNTVPFEISQHGTNLNDIKLNTTDSLQTNPTDAVNPDEIAQPVNVTTETPDEGTDTGDTTVNEANQKQKTDELDTSPARLQEMFDAPSVPDPRAKEEIENLEKLYEASSNTSERNQNPPNDTTEEPLLVLDQALQRDDEPTTTVGERLAEVRVALDRLDQPTPIQAEQRNGQPTPQHEMKTDPKVLEETSAQKSQKTESLERKRNKLFGSLLRYKEKRAALEQRESQTQSSLVLDTTAREARLVTAMKVALAAFQKGIIAMILDLKGKTMVTGEDLAERFLKSVSANAHSAIARARGFFDNQITYIANGIRGVGKVFSPDEALAAMNTQINEVQPVTEGQGPSVRLFDIVTVLGKMFGNKGEER